MRKELDEKLGLLNREMILMGSICEKNIADVFKALEKGDRDLAFSVYKEDYDIGAKARDIERLCLSLILREQPVAGDLRLVSAVLKMISDLKRIGIQCCDIAEIVMKFDFSYKGADVALLPGMALEAQKILRKAVDSFVNMDFEAAREVFRMDEAVDGYFSMVRESIVSEAKHGPGADIKIALDVLMIAKYLERIGDHACNIAKWVLYIGGETEAKGEPA